MDEDRGDDAQDIADSKTGPRAVPLGEAARAHIEALPAACNPNAFLFSRYAEGRATYSVAVAEKVRKVIADAMKEAGTGLPR